jgi:hypothetical protein
MTPIRAGIKAVFRGLPVGKNSKAERLPPTIALVARVLPGELVICLRVGGVGNSIRFSRKPRRCDPLHFDREATAREIAVGFVDPGSNGVIHK